MKEPIRKKRVTLKLASVKEIVKLSKKGYANRALSEKFYVTYSTIHNVLNGKTHSNITGIQYKKKYKMNDINKTMNKVIEKFAKDVDKDVDKTSVKKTIKSESKSVNININLLVNGERVQVKDIANVLALINS